MAGSGDPHRTRRWLPDAPLSRVAAVSVDQASAFGILRRPLVESDRIPEERWGAYAQGMRGRLGLNPALARRANSDVGDVCVIPGNGFICLDVGGMCCNTIENAMAQGIVTWTSTQSGDQNIIHGLVPDGVEEVRLVASDGITKIVSVCDNVYGALLAGFTSVRFTGPAGPVVVGPFGA